LARCVEVLERHPDVVLTYPKTRLIDERGAVIRDYEDGLHLQGSRASERFALLLARLGYCNALYGLMRADAMRRTRLVGDYIGSDEVFQAELALYGTFFEIPEFLFLRRMHEAASSSMTVLQKQAFYQPRGRPRAALTGWRHLGEHMRSVMNAPLSVGERLRLMRVLLRRAIGSREMLAGELVGAVRQLRPGPA
jgi:hypothetical protein